MSARKIRSTIGLSATRWAEARSALLSRGRITEESLEIDREVKVRLTEDYLRRRSNEAKLPTIGSRASKRAVG